MENKTTTMPKMRRRRALSFIHMPSASMLMLKYGMMMSAIDDQARNQHARDDGREVVQHLLQPQEIPRALWPGWACAWGRRGLRAARPRSERPTTSAMARACNRHNSHAEFLPGTSSRPLFVLHLDLRRSPAGDECDTAGVCRLSESIPAAKSFGVLIGAPLGDRRCRCRRLCGCARSGSASNSTAASGRITQCST